MTGGEDRQRLAAVPRLTGLVDTIRTEGVGWVWRRLRYRTPATPAGRKLHGWLRRAIKIALAPARIPARGTAALAHPTLLYAFYDLQVSPITYDAAWFAIGADRARRRQHLAGVHFVVVPGKLGGVREERAAYEAVVDREARRWRVHNLLVPIFGLVPAIAGYTVLPSRDEVAALCAGAAGRVYPNDYGPALPVGHHPSEILDAGQAGETGLAVLESPPQARRFVDQWLTSRLDDRRLVTITLRDYAFMPARNSNVDAWATFARRLPRDRYFPVFLLDTERTLDPLPPVLGDMTVFREASWSVPLRLALYEKAFLNLGVNNGPLLMGALAARPRLLVFKMLTPSVPQTTADFMERLGFEIGGQLSFAGPWQRLVWQDDDLEVITREFETMVAGIEATTAGVIDAGSEC